MTEMAKKNFFKVADNFWICLLLVLATATVYYQVVKFDFINFDTDQYVYENSYVMEGLTVGSINWAFHTMHLSNWHPLTWLSHMLDVEMYGMDAGRHHLTNMLFHIANSLLLFVILKQITVAKWRSAIVAALFALHPLHVESVVWIAERKDLLSTFLGLLAIMSYARYMQRPGIRDYLLTVLFFILSLMAKPMMVTLPFILLLLDYWPLRRFHFDRSGTSKGRQKASLSSPISLVIEKIPLFILSAASSIITIHAQNIGGSTASLTAVPLQLRIENAVVAYGVYIGEMFWPFNLSIYYPYPDMLPIRKVILCVLLLTVITYFAIRLIKSRPWFLVGWLWYLGTLVPVIGIVQVGGQAMADRYTYIPLIGLFVIIAWGLNDLLAFRSHNKLVLTVISLVLVGCLSAVTWNQVGYWKSSETVFKHALAVTENNLIAHNNLGSALAAAGRQNEAYVHFSSALKINPKFVHANVNIGVELLRQGRLDEAISQFIGALKLDSDNAEAHNNLGLALIRQGKVAAAVRHFQVAVKQRPTYVDARRNLNLALFIQRKINQAVANIDKALINGAEDPNLEIKLGNLSKEKINLDLAVGLFNKTLSLQPGYTKIDPEDIPVVGGAKKRYEDALFLLLEVSQLRPDVAEAYYHIACIYARQGRIAASIKNLEQAIQKGFNQWGVIKADSDLENIRKYDGYQLLVRRLENVE